MKPRPSEPADSLPDPLAHIDPSRWEEIIRAAGPDAMLVVIRSTMSKKLREHLAPEDIWRRR